MTDFSMSDRKKTLKLEQETKDLKKEKRLRRNKVENREIPKFNKPHNWLDDLGKKD